MLTVTAGDPFLWDVFLCGIDVKWKELLASFLEGRSRIMSRLFNLKTAIVKTHLKVEISPT
jgi:hypothetical protein